MDEKTCRRCGVSKPPGEFYDDKDYRDDKNPWCKECVSKYNKEYRAARKGARSYPQREYAQIQTTTDLSCSKCRKAIELLEKCLVSDDGKYYHEGCKPSDGPEAKGDIGPSVASGKGGEDG